VAGDRLASAARVESGEVAVDGGDDDATCDEPLLVELAGVGDRSSSIVLSLGGVVDATVLGVLLVVATPALLEAPGLGCVVVAGEDAELGLLPLDADAVRELSGTSWLEKSER
jgi:hypothetical protein